MVPCPSARSGDRNERNRRNAREERAVRIVGTHRVAGPRHGIAGTHGRNAQFAVLKQSISRTHSRNAAPFERTRTHAMAGTHGRFE